jgi:chromosome segregation ATPase
MNLRDDVTPPSDAQGAEASHSPDASPLHDTVGTLSRMVKELEKQLERMLSINNALEADLEKERKRTSLVEKERDDIREKYSRIEQELTTLEDLRAEIDHLVHDRGVMAGTIEELGRQLAESEQEHRNAEQLISRVSAERDDAVEELLTVEDQFDRAMKLVSDLKIRLTSLDEERNSLVARIKALESQLHLSETQREALKAEVEESQKALDDIRRQVADACVLSQRYHADQDEKE